MLTLVSLSQKCGLPGEVSCEHLSAVDTQTPEMCQDDSPFYLSINHKHKPGSHWYKKQPLGIHTKSMP